MKTKILYVALAIVALAMGAASFFIFSALWMSVTCAVIMAGVWWLLRQGY